MIPNPNDPFYRIRHMLKNKRPSACGEKPLLVSVGKTVPPWRENLRPPGPDVYNAQWKSNSVQIVDISILHHPEHTHNLERMVQGVQASFNYPTGEFGKYPHSEIRFTEVP